MGKIGDLWVKLGLKKDGFDKGLKDAQTQTASFGSKMKSLGTKAAALWTAIGVGALAAAKQFVQHSQKFGDAWDQTMSRMKSAWGQFLTSLTSWDWDGFWSRVRGGADAASRSTAAHDAEYEVQNAIRLRKAQLQEELSALQIEMRDTKKSYDERAKAAEDYLTKVKPLYDEEEKLRRNIYLADTGEYLAAAGMKKDAAHRKALEDFLTDIAPNESLMTALVDYSKHAQGKNTKITQAAKDAADAIARTYGDAEFAALATLAQYYTSTNESEATKVVDAIEAMYASRAAFNEETRRIQTLKNSAEASSGIDTSAINTGTVAADDGSTDAAKILKRAEDAAKSEIELLNEKYNEEKAMLQKYGMDTEALTNEYLSNLLDLNGDWLNDIINQAEEIEPVEIEPVKLDDSKFEKFIESLRRMQEQAEQLAQEFNDAVVSGFSAGMQELTDQLFGLSEVNPGAIFKALLEPLADMAVREGELLIVQGLGIEAIKTALSTLQGGAAIATGAALVAIGSAVKSGLSAIASTGGSNTSVSTYQGGSGVQTQQIETELTVYVEGRISGDAIALSGQRTINNWNR